MLYYVCNGLSFNKQAKAARTCLDNLPKNIVYHHKHSLIFLPKKFTRLFHGDSTGGFFGTWEVFLISYLVGG